MTPKHNINNHSVDAQLALHDEANLFPAVDDAVEISIACSPEDYSASRIARAIEDCDAHLLNLNVTARHLPDGFMAVLLRAGMRNPDSAVRALERYGFRVVEVHSPVDLADDSLHSRIDELFTHLNV